MAKRRKHSGHDRASRSTNGGRAAHGLSSRHGLASNGVANNPPEPATLPIEWNWRSYSIAALLAAAFVWSYWPVLGTLASTWNTVPDYSHGYFVIPVAGYLLWSRRASMPGRAAGFAWGGLILLLLSMAVRIGGSLWYIDAIEAWSLPLWVAGAIWLLAGRPMLWWAAPAVIFLGFMIPLPFRAETLLSGPLQSVASRLSCWFLQTLGQPAIREGNVVLIGDVRLNVVEACSGLRIFISICALAFIYDALAKKPWWTRCALLAAVAPVAVLANALRITLTGLLHVKISGEAAHRFSHDFAGWMMLPVAAVLLAAWLWYVGRLIVERQTVSATDLLYGGMPPSAA